MLVEQINLHNVHVQIYAQKMKSIFVTYLDFSHAHSRDSLFRNIFVAREYITNYVPFLVLSHKVAIRSEFESQKRVPFDVATSED